MAVLEPGDPRARGCVVKPLLAVVSPLAPYPPLAGGTAHLIGAIQQLSRFYRLHLYVLADDPQAVAWGPLPTWCERTVAIPRTGRRIFGLAPPGLRQ